MNIRKYDKGLKLRRSFFLLSIVVVYESHADLIKGKLLKPNHKGAIEDNEKSDFSL